MIMLLSNLGQYKMKTMYSSNTDVIVVPETLHITRYLREKGKIPSKNVHYVNKKRISFEHIDILPVSKKNYIRKGGPWHL